MRDPAGVFRSGQADESITLHWQTEPEIEATYYFDDCDRKGLIR